MQVGSRPSFWPVLVRVPVQILEDAQPVSHSLIGCRGICAPAAKVVPSSFCSRGLIGPLRDRAGWRRRGIGGLLRIQRHPTRRPLWTARATVLEAKGTGPWRALLISALLVVSVDMHTCTYHEEGLVQLPTHHRASVGLLELLNSNMT